mmetsp:Transcript_48350/g.90567  ORF Transcript_48350/g.90567 Transcript_48350/m.90567 type:complete len:257 (+) Transcript_48350:2-772(+)
MKLVIQRVTQASVEVESAIVGKIGKGLLILLGIEHGDTVEQAKQLGTKVAKIRLWPDLKDPNKQWASSVVDNGYEMLVVSQFTLFATFKKPKPDFHQAMGGDQAKEIYEVFVQHCREALSGDKVATGTFGAMMQVALCNDGPVTVELVAEAPASDADTSPKKAAGDGAAKAKGAAKDKAPAGGSERSPGSASAADAELETLLEAQPYVAGFSPSHRDAELFERARAPGQLPPSAPNTARWFEHIASFSSLERSQWK